jgi:hypothetical protein
MERQQKQETWKDFGHPRRLQGGNIEIEMDHYKLKCHVQYKSEALTSISTSKEHSSRQEGDKVNDEEYGK